MILLPWQYWLQVFPIRMVLLSYFNNLYGNTTKVLLCTVNTAVLPSYPLSWHALLTSLRTANRELVNQYGVII